MTSIYRALSNGLKRILEEKEAERAKVAEKAITYGSEILERIENSPDLPEGMTWGECLHNGNQIQYESVQEAEEVSYIPKPVVNGNAAMDYFRSPQSISLRREINGRYGA